MAGEYLIKVKATLDQQDAKQMEAELNGRFTRVANKFGSALKKGLKRLSISGLVAGAVYSVLNDIDKMNTAIDETLEKYKDIQSQAAAQNLLPSEYWRLSRLSQIAGVKDFDSLFSAFRQTLNKTNRGFNTPLNQFRGQSADAQTFLQVLSSLQAADPRTRQLVSESVFGQAGAQDVNKLLAVDLTDLGQKAFAGIDNNKFNEAITRGIAASREQMIEEVKREYTNLQTRGQILRGGAVAEQARYRMAEDAYTNELLKNYKTTAEVNKAMLTVQQNVANGVNKSVSWLQKIFGQLQSQAAADRQLRAGKITEEEYNRITGSIYE